MITPDLHGIVADILTIISDGDRIDICQFAHIRFRYNIVSAQFGFYNTLGACYRYSYQITVVQHLIYFSFLLQQICVNQSDLNIIEGYRVLRIIDLCHQKPQYKGQHQRSKLQSKITCQ